VAFGYVDITTAQFQFKPDNGGKLPNNWTDSYDPATGILTLTTDMSSIANVFDITQPANKPTGQQLCEPSTLCAWNNTANKCQCAISDPTNYLYSECHEKNAAGDDAICSWSVKDLDCPAQGCPGLQITFPTSFAPDDAADHHRPVPSLFSFDPNFQKDWNISFNNEDASISGQQCNYSSPPPLQACPTNP
jgi:hypothetical protein